MTTTCGSLESTVGRKTLPRCEKALPDRRKDDVEPQDCLREQSYFCWEDADMDDEKEYSGLLEEE